MQNSKFYRTYVIVCPFLRGCLYLSLLAAWYKYVIILSYLLNCWFVSFSGWNIRCMASGNMHHVVGADDSCISWGVAQNGELGYGPNGQKYVYIKMLRICWLYKGFTYSMISLAIVVPYICNVGHLQIPKRLTFLRECMLQGNTKWRVTFHSLLTLQSVLNCEHFLQCRLWIRTVSNCCGQGKYWWSTW